MSDHDALCWMPNPDHAGECFGSIAKVRADEQEQVAEAIEVLADDLDWDDALAAGRTGELAAIRDYGKTLLHAAAQIAREART